MPNKIETVRLMLRLIALEDAERINLLINDKTIAANCSRIPFPCPLKETKTFIKTCIEADLANGVIFTIILKTTNEIIGVIGLEIEPQHERGTMGYWLGRNYWGNGYATEAVTAILKSGFEQFKLNRIEADCMSNNKASSKILKKVGMQYEGCAKEYVKKDGVFKDMEHYAILRKDYYRS